MDDARVREMFSRVRDLQGRLGRALDDLNRGILAAEAAMRYRFGDRLTACVPFRGGDLLFVDGRLVYVRDGTWSHVTHTSKLHRLLVVDALWDLAAECAAVEEERRAASSRQEAAR